MANLVIGKLLQFVRGPMAEIQRAGRAGFKRVAARGDVLDVQVRATIESSAASPPARSAASKGASALQAFEKVAVANQRHLDRLGETGAFVALGQRGQKIEIVDDRERRRESADEILFAEGVDAVLDARPRNRSGPERSSARARGARRDARWRPPAPPRPATRRRRCPRRTNGGRYDAVRFGNEFPRRENKTSWPVHRLR